MRTRKFFTRCPLSFCRWESKLFFGESFAQVQLQFHWTHEHPQVPFVRHGMYA